LEAKRPNLISEVNTLETYYPRMLRRDCQALISPQSNILCGSTMYEPLILPAESWRMSWVTAGLWRRRWRTQKPTQFSFTFPITAKGEETESIPVCLEESQRTQKHSLCGCGIRMDLPESS